MAAAAGSVRNTAVQETSAAGSGDGFSAFPIKKIALLALAALTIGAIVWKNGITSPTFIVAVIWCVIAYPSLSQSLHTLYFARVCTEADREKAFASKTFYQLYRQFGLDSAISLFGADGMMSKLQEEISDPKTTLAHLVVRYPLELIVEKGLLPKDVFELIRNFKDRGQKDGNLPLLYGDDYTERYNAFSVYNWHPSHFRNLAQLNHEFCVEKAKLGFGQAPEAISPFSWETGVTEKPVSTRGHSNRTEWEKSTLHVGSFIAGIGAIGAVAAATLFKAHSTNALAAAVVLVGASRWLTYLHGNVLKRASQQDKEAIFNKNSFFTLIDDYGLDALLEAGFTVEDLREKFTLDFLHPGTTFWDMIVSDRHQVLLDKGIITKGHFDYLEGIKKEAAQHWQRIVVRSHSVLRAWDAYAQASVAIEAAVKIDAQYQQDKEGLL